MNKKENYLKKDRILKAVTADRFFRISVVKTTDVVKTAQKKHNLSLISSIILGRALTGAMLLASDLKNEERLSLRIEGSGPIGHLIAEANSSGEIRGYVQNPEAQLELRNGATIGDGLGLGLLTVSKVLYNEARPVNGTVELASGNISEDLAYYLLQSEQIASAVSIDVSLDNKGVVNHAGGVLIQALPGAPDGKRELLQQNLSEMNTIASLLRDGHYVDDILRIVTRPYEVKELTRYPVHFFCRCSKERFKNALYLVDFEELADMANEGHDLVCHFCNSKYHISGTEIDEIVQELKIKMN
ncbi:MAG: Hsp33 family molecular chaperone HslO [Cyclonatronaceae bacterium]